MFDKYANVKRFVKLDITLMVWYIEVLLRIPEGERENHG